METRRVVAIVQARMGSERLFGKIFLPLQGRPLLSFLLDRLKRARHLDAIVVATTKEVRDRETELLAERNEVFSYRGSTLDVLERYYEAAVAFQATHIVRVCADCPLVDPSLVDELITLYDDSYPTADYISNCTHRTFARGFDLELFTMEALRQVHLRAQREHEREHVTPYFYGEEGRSRFRLASFTTPKSSAHYRLTVDVREDFDLIQEVVAAIYPNYPQFGYAEIIDFLDANPKVASRNHHISQKSIIT